MLFIKEKNVISLRKQIEKTFVTIHTSKVFSSYIGNAKLEAMQHWKIRVVGKVQGVGYRAFVCNEANLLNLKGFVRNGNDGGVQIEVEGEELVLEELVDKCFKGPALARVESIDTTEGRLRHYEKFEIQR